MKNNIFNNFPKITITLVILILTFIGMVILDILLTHTLNSLKIKEQQKLNNNHYKIRISNPIYHHTFASNSKSKELEPRTGNYTLFTNSLGFKDQFSRKVSLKSKKYRILFIGDSFTEGIALDYEDTFVGLIDNALSKKNIEVLNAGRAGYSPIIYWRKIKHLIEDVGLEFHEVVVFIDTSDAKDESQLYELSEDMNVIKRINLPQSSNLDNITNNINNEQTLQRKKIKIIKKLKSLIYNNTTAIYNLTNFFYDLFGFATKEGGEWSYILNDYEADKWTLNVNYYQKYAKDGIILMKKYMNTLYDLLSKNKINLTIAVYPRPVQIWYDDLHSIHVEIWEEWSKKKNVKFINYFPEFISNNTSKREKIKTFKEYYIIGDPHFNKNGNKIIADKFIKFYLKKDGIISSDLNN